MLLLEFFKKNLEISVAFQAPIKTLYNKEGKIKLSLQEKWLSEEKTINSKFSDDEIKNNSLLRQREKQLLSSFLESSRGKTG